MRKWFLNFCLPCSRKNRNIKFLLAPLKILSISKNCSSLPLFSLVHNDIHGWLSEQFSGSQAVTEELKAVITKRQPKIVKTISDHSKGTILIFRAFKTKIFLS
jgi:hypothetical protein